MRDHSRYEGKHVQRHSHKWLALLTAVVLVAAMSVGGTLAWLSTHTEPVTNTFVMGSVNPVIGEDFNDPYTQKSNITVTNTGTVEAYVRVALVFTWRDNADVGKNPSNTGNIVGVPVAGQDYTFVMETGWIQGSDGYYYYKYPVGPQGSSNAITSSLGTITVQNTENAAKYNLDVQVLADSIQSQPTSAVETTWGVTLDSDGNIQNS